MRIQRMLRGLSDALSTLHPILRRELLAFLRGRKAFWILCVIVAGTGLLPLLSWPEEAGAGSAVVGRQVFGTYLAALFFLLAILVPLVTGAAIAGERERRTLEELLGTRLSPVAIVYGKLISSLGFFVLAVVATVPLAAVAYLLGGISFGNVLEGFAVLLVSTLFFGAVGIACSLHSKTTLWAVIAAYALLALLAPVLASSFAFSPDDGLFLAPFLMVSGFSIVVALVIAFPDAQLAGEPAQGLEEAAVPLNVRVRTTLLHLGTWRVWKSPDQIPDRWNPVFADAIRRSITSQTSFPVVLAFLASPVLCFLVLKIILEGERGLFIAGCVVLAAGTGLSLPGSAASLLIEARRTGALGDVRSTPLRAREVLGGYLMAALFAARFLLAISVLFVLICLAAGWRDDSGPGLLVYLDFTLSLAALVPICATSGLLAAALSRNGLQALVLAYLLPLLWLAVFCLAAPPTLDMLLYLPLGLCVSAAQFGLAVVCLEREPAGHR